MDTQEECTRKKIVWHSGKFVSILSWVCRFRHSALTFRRYFHHEKWSKQSRVSSHWNPKEGWLNERHLNNVRKSATDNTRSNQCALTKLNVIFRWRTSYSTQRLSCPHIEDVNTTSGASSHHHFAEIKINGTHLPIGNIYTKLIQEIACKGQME